MDYHAWTERVRLFSENLSKLPGEIDITPEIDSTIDDETIDALAHAWPTGIPESLRALWSEGSSRINCRYVWTPPQSELCLLHNIFEYNNYIYGGARFGAADQIFPGNSGADPNDHDMAETLGIHGLELWCRSAIFLDVGNGDCLGLDPTTNPQNPPVVYLVHDEDESRIISPSLAEFLSAWQELSYIGPEIWLLDYWLNSDKGCIDVAKHKTDELRSLLIPRT